MGSLVEEVRWLMSIMDPIASMLVANAIEGLKRKPMLIAHFIFAIILSFSLYHVLELLGLDLYIMYIIAIIGLPLSLSLYIGIMESLQNYIHRYLPGLLDEMLADYKNFVRYIDETIYGIVAKHLKSVSKRRFFAIFISVYFSYYFIWISVVFLIDLVILTLSKNGYSLLEYVAENSYFIYIACSALLSLVQLIHPWSRGSQRSRNNSQKTSSISNAQYVEAFLERFTSLEGLGKKWRRSGRAGAIKVIFSRSLQNLLEGLMVTPLIRSARILITDYFQIPYSGSGKSSGKHLTKIFSIIEKRLIESVEKVHEEYKLEPLNKNCRYIPKIDTSRLGRDIWCWYKVLRKKGDKDNYEAIGYAMLFDIPKDRALHIFLLGTEELFWFKWFLINLKR